MDMSESKAQGDVAGTGKRNCGTGRFCGGNISSVSDTTYVYDSAWKCDKNFASFVGSTGHADERMGCAEICGDLLLSLLAHVIVSLLSCFSPSHAHLMALPAES